MPDDIKSISSYEQDFSAWSLAQAEALRAARDVILSAGRRRADLPSVLQRLDWDNLAEEIEGLAKKDRREISSQITTIIEHLAKLEFSSAAPPRADWINTVQREREEVEDILRDSPSLRREANQLWPVAPALRSVGPAEQYRGREKLKGGSRDVCRANTRLNRSWATGCRKPRPPPRTAATAVAGAA